MIKPFNIVVDGKSVLILEAKAKKAVVKIVGEISWWKNSSAEFTNKVEEFLEAGITDIHGYINTGGGSVFDANEIANQIRLFTGTRSCQVGALCASSGTIVLMAFEKEHTTGAKNGNYMAHNPTSYLRGEAKDLRSGAALLDNIKEQILDGYEERMSESRAKISERMDNTWWMTAKQAHKNGLIGHLGEDKASLPEDTATVLNKYQYDNIPDVLNSTNLKMESNSSHYDPKISKTTKSDNMKNFIQVIMAMFPVLATAHNLTEESTEQEAIRSIQAFVGAKDEEIQKLKDQIKANAEGNVKDLLDNAVAVEKITAEQRTKFEKIGETSGYEPLKEVIDAMPARKKVANSVDPDNSAFNEGDQEPEERKNWKWEDYMENNAGEDLQKMEDSNPEKYNRLKNAYYNEQ